MTMQASPTRYDFGSDASVPALAVALLRCGAVPLRIEYAGRISRLGYHVTEVKAAALVTLDCGGNPDQWREVILQVEDAELADGASPMTAAKLTAILEKVASRVELDADARLTFEVGFSGEPMQVFDVGALEVLAGQATLRLTGRSAVCKPRHRAEMKAETSKCCGPVSKHGSACC
ncbi:MAG: hypothetical protein ABS35_41590 [Kaistia sp. SCN 65-12]|nr:MAG: hypothetical protein ABS35_41590 [Kaistia sp. SCN 65-12]